MKMNDKNTSQIIGDSSYIKHGNMLYDVSLLIFNKDKKYDDYDKDTAYVEDDKFFILRGDWDPSEEHPLPGIYKASNGGIKIVHPTTASEIEEYTLNEENLINSNIENIIEVLKHKESLYVSIPENYLPSSIGKLAENDTLKRALQEALLEKGIDIDLCAKRFKDKNAFLNFKQAMKNEQAKLSMMLFERGCDVFNFKFTIIVEEADPDIAIGPRLKEPIIISSDNGEKI